MTWDRKAERKERFNKKSKGRNKQNRKEQLRKKDGLDGIKDLK